MQNDSNRFIARLHTHPVYLIPAILEHDRLGDENDDFSDFSTAVKSHDGAVSMNKLNFAGQTSRTMRNDAFGTISANGQLISANLPGDV